MSKEEEEYGMFMYFGFYGRGRPKTSHWKR